MTTASELFLQARRQFPALHSTHAGRPVVFLDGPAGTQVPQRVVDAMSRYLLNCNANHGGLFATSRESDQWLDRAHAAVADLLNAGDPQTIAFGQNMTSLTFAMSRALARTWSDGDEVLVTRLDHDANIRPWMLAAEDAGCRVRMAEVRPDGTLDVEDLRNKLSEKTRLVAVGCASNSTGSINPVREICQWARDVGAVSFLDAVHYAPHAPIDVQEIGCDLLVCSAYKFFGPHLGIQWGRRELLESLTPYKLRPAPESLPGRWMTGTQSHESIVGTMAAIEYLADLGRQLQPTDGSRRNDLLHAMRAIQSFERDLVAELLRGLHEIPEITVHGINDEARLAERLPTVSITHQTLSPSELASRLGEAGIYVWHGNYYAIELTDAWGLEPEGMVRLGLLHYNTSEEVQRLLTTLRQLTTAACR